MRVLLLALSFVALFFLTQQLCSATPLDDYVLRPDPTYTWSLNRTDHKPSYTAYTLHLISQTWLTAADSSKPVWDHWLQIIIPHQRDTDWCFMYINGDHNTDKPPADMDVLTELVAIETRSCAATIFQIPNEPIFFADGKRRTEDAIIAYTWKHFIEHPDQPDWLVRLPMTKAVFKGMDAVEEFLAGQRIQTIPSWVVAGASKRGWTTWTVAAVDANSKKRVKAIAPIVMDALNLVKNINHMWQSYGFWTFAFEDYTNENVTRYLNTPMFEQLAGVEDPYTYKDRLTMPKYVIDATGDEFFQMDDNWYWFGDLPGETYLRMVPNAEHSLTGSQVDVTLAASTFYRSMFLNVPRPKISWTRDVKTGKIVMTASPKPDKVLMWHGYNRKARDFRIIVCMDVIKDPNCIQPIIWTYKHVEPEADGTYVALRDTPDVGYEGWFMEAEWRADLGMVGEHFFKFTTQVSIVPAALPFPPCGNPCGPPSNVETFSGEATLVDGRA